MSLWSDQSVREVNQILTQPASVTGWHGVGYSVIEYDKGGCASAFGFRGGLGHLENLLSWIKDHELDDFYIRYYCAFFGASVLRNQVYRLENGPITVVAQLGILGYASGAPAPTVEGTQACEQTMRMIHDITKEMSDCGALILLERHANNW